MKRWLNTIDLDYPHVNQLIRVIEKINQCPYLESLSFRYSAGLNGVHIRFLCQHKCDLCRVVFDDQFRYCADYVNRKPYQRNVLHRSKPYKKNRHQITLYTDQWTHLRGHK